MRMPLLHYLHYLHYLHFCFQLSTFHPPHFLFAFAPFHVSRGSIIYSIFKAGGTPVPLF
jgi:hypothetical protein